VSHYFIRRPIFAIVIGMAPAILLSLFFIPVFYFAGQTPADKVRGRRAGPVGTPVQPAEAVDGREGGPV
jgi:hypothetical protein